MQHLRRFWQRSSHVKWVLADQIIVSGMNFLTGILLARFLGLEGYGQFVLLYAIFLYANTFQVALIVAPMMSIAPQMQLGEPRLQYMKGTLTLQIGFTLLLCLGLLILGQFADVYFPRWNLPLYQFPLIASIFSFQLQDWLRRYYFIYQKGKSVFFNDSISYGGQVIVLLILHHLNQFTIERVFWGIACTSALAFGVGALIEKLALNLTDARQAFQKSWHTGRNLLVAGQIHWLGSQGILILGASFLGTRAAGGIRAAQNIVGPFNILFQAMDNFIPVQAAHQYAEKQLIGLVQYMQKVCLGGGLLIALPCAIIAVLSPWIMEFAYGVEYREFAPLVIWQLAAAFAVFYQLQGFYFYRTIHQTRIIIWNTIISTTAALLFTYVLGQYFQEIGIAIALFIGQLSGLIFFAIAISHFLKKTLNSTSAPTLNS
ncbi:MAG: hypothetical protein LRZ84_19550 [Desertifilum sp.]|nr:hypothetical protein [Desertifilum sp.]